MDGLTVHVGWEYFLGIMSGLILVAWYSSGRFKALETSMDWVRISLDKLETSVNDIKITVDTTKTPVFVSQSPINLNETGEQWLTESGLKEYIDSHRKNLESLCIEKKSTNPYEVQKYIFELLDSYEFENSFDERLKRFAYEKGSTMSVVRRVGAIYLRNLCLETFGMERGDIDKHDPEKRPL